MTQPEETPVSFIPSNFIEKGKILNGTFDIRNAIESIVLSLAIGIPVFHLPLSLTARIIILCMTALPAAMVALIGIGGESITAFLMNALRFVVNRRVIWRSDSLPEGKPRRKPRFKEPKTKKHRKAEKMAEPSKVMASAPPQSEPDAPAPPKSKKKEHRQFDTSTKRGIKKQAKEDIRYLKWEQKEASRQKKEAAKQIKIQKKTEARRRKEEEKRAVSEKRAAKKEQKKKVVSKEDTSSATSKPVSRKKRKKDQTLEDYLPVEKIANGIVYTTDGRYVKILEIEPINFLLRSAREQQGIIYSFISYLKISPVKLQIKMISKKADINKHLEQSQLELERETDPHCQELQRDYIQFVQNLSSREAVSRRFFLIFEYEPFNANRKEEEREILAALETASQTAKTFLYQCGNEVVSHDNEDEFTTDVLYTLLNRTLCTEVPLSNRISTVLSAYTKENRMEELDHIRINEFLAPESVDFKHSHYVQINGLYHSYLLVPSDGCLPLGTITVQESKAPAGYQLNPTVFVQKITGDGKQEMVSVYQSSTIEESVIRGGVKIQKRDSETGEAKPQGSATLEGTVFAITTLNENPVLVDGTSYTKDQVVLTLTADKSGSAATAKDALPFGHYRVDETTAPSGYLNSGKISVEFDITEQGKIVELTAKDNSISNQVIRGDLEFVKIADGSQNRLANVPFKITSKTTGESHVIVTDANGYASTSSKWNKHTANTNRGESSEDGIWFGTSKPDDSKGALIYDTYTLAEQRCDSNKGMDLLTFEVKVYKDSVLIQVGTLTDDAIEIGTTALDAETGTHMSQPAKEVTIEDVVEYEGLKKGQKYKLTGTLMDKKTGEPILVDEKPVISETEFTAKKSSGSVKVTFTFDATSLKGKTTVVFEELYQDEMQLAVHTDINDEDQTIYFPEIKTTAKDADTNSNISCAKEEITLVDTVSFKGLVPNQKYEVTGTLIDKETKKPVEADGKPVTAKASFKPKESAGTVDVTFTFDASSLKGKTVVVFESLAYKDKEVAVHTDIADEGQTIYFPEIKTTATDAASGTHYAKPEKELTLTDLVEYKNLIPGKEYKLTGTLMDAETEKPFDVDGKAVTAETSFTPEEANGSVELSFTFDASALSGKTLVAFETMTFEDHEVAVHADIKDANQTIYFPEIKTTAKDGSDGDQDVSASKEATIVDTVTYHGLMPGSEYKVIGTLMNKETGEALLKDGKPVTAQAEFKAEKAGGSVEVTFTFDASALAGQDVVVFEKLYYTDGKTEHEIASHEDLKDEGQTVHMTELPKEPETPPVAPPVKTGDETPLLLYAGIAIAALAGASVLGIVYFKRKKKHQ